MQMHQVMRAQRPRMLLLPPGILTRVVLHSRQHFIATTEPQPSCGGFKCSLRFYKLGYSHLQGTNPYRDARQKDSPENTSGQADGYEGQSTLQPRLEKRALSQTKHKSSPEYARASGMNSHNSGAVINRRWSHYLLLSRCQPLLLEEVVPIRRASSDSSFCVTMGKAEQGVRGREQD